MENKQKFKEILLKVLKGLRTSAAIMLATAILGTIYGFITRGGLWLAYTFNSSIGAGTVVIFAGLVIYMLPPITRKKGRLAELRLLDNMMKAKEKKNAWAYYIMCVGLGVVIISAITQYIAYLLVNQFILYAS